MMDRDSITRTGARTPGVKRQWPLERWCTSAPRPSPQIGDTTLQAARCTKGGLQTARREELAVDGQAPSDIPAFQPDWGKPTVRNDRGDDGNVSIIRSLVRAIVLPDRWQQGLEATCEDFLHEVKAEGEKSQTGWANESVGAMTEE
jgi:hypothetical protein